MAVTITDQQMTSNQTPVHGYFRQHAAADGTGAWIVRRRYHPSSAGTAARW